MILNVLLSSLHLRSLKLIPPTRNPPRPHNSQSNPTFLCSVFCSAVIFPSVRHDDVAYRRHHQSFPQKKRQHLVPPRQNQSNQRGTNCNNIIVPVSATFSRLWYIMYSSTHPFDAVTASGGRICGEGCVSVGGVGRWE